MISKIDHQGIVVGWVKSLENNCTELYHYHSSIWAGCSPWGMHSLEITCMRSTFDRVTYRIALPWSPGNTANCSTSSWTWSNPRRQKGGDAGVFLTISLLGKGQEDRTFLLFHRLIWNCPKSANFLQCIRLKFVWTGIHCRHGTRKDMKGTQVVLRSNMAPSWSTDVDFISSWIAIPPAVASLCWVFLIRGSLLGEHISHYQSIINQLSINHQSISTNEP